MDNVQKSSENICVLHDAHKRWAKLLREEEMLYLYAMTGFGKTTQALAFAQAEYRQWLRLSASEENFIDKVEEAAEYYANSRTTVLLILDDLQWIFQEAERQRFFELLLRMRRNRRIHVFLISRAYVPAYLTPLQVTRQMTVENQEILRFDEKNNLELMLTYPSLAKMPGAWQTKIVRECQKVARGYPLGMNALYQRLEKNTDDIETAVSLATQDVYDYLAIHLFGEWSSSRKNSVIVLSVYQEFSREMAVHLLGEQADRVLKDFREVGSFLHFKAPDTYSIVEFFRGFLESQLMKRPKEEWIQLYETAAGCYEKQRDYAQALRCWKRAGRKDKIAETVVYLSENAEGCDFAKIAQDYITELSPEWEQRDPRIVGAKVMLAAYRMQPEECLRQLDRLKQMADEEKGCVMRGGAQAAYVRTAIACPYDTAEELKDNMFLFADYVRKNGFHLKNIMPTGNMPSLINGGLDLLPWEKNKMMLYPLIKGVSELIMGKDAVGIADAAMGEILYEQNQRTKAMAYLTKSISASNYNGSIRVQYAATAIMARLFQSEGQQDTADEIIRNVMHKAEEEKFKELLPNIYASLIYGALFRNDTVSCDEWLKLHAPDEYETFYITMRYQLLIKARVYTARGRNLDALYILNLLENFAKLYKRTYFMIEVKILQAIIMFRREEPWQETLLSAVELAEDNGLVRVFADQGAALLTMWRAVEWEHAKIVPAKLAIITREMKRMAVLYPGYLKVHRQCGELSPKELQVLRLMSDGCNNPQIAEILNVNIGTVKYHVKNIMKKMDVESRTVAVKIAQEEGLL